MNTKKSDKLLLSLFIAGKTLKSIAALKNLKYISDELLKGKYRIEVIDLLKNPKLAREHQIIAIPTLVKKLPLPKRNIIGDLSNRELVMKGLNINVKG